MQEEMKKLCVKYDKMIIKQPDPMPTLKCCTDKTNKIPKRIFDIRSDQANIHADTLDIRERKQ